MLILFCHITNFWCMLLLLVCKSSENASPKIYQRCISDIKKPTYMMSLKMTQDLVYISTVEDVSQKIRRYFNIFKQHIKCIKNLSKFIPCQSELNKTGPRAQAYKITCSISLVEETSLRNVNIAHDYFLCKKKVPFKDKLHVLTYNTYTHLRSLFSL